MNLLIAHKDDFFKLFDAKENDKYDLLETYTDLDEPFTEAFFNDRDMVEAEKKWNDVEEK